MVDIGQVINGKYRVVRLIGDGGMGSVYEAHHEVLGARVALKFLHPELCKEFNLKERFLQEARVSATIDSPHIVRVLDVDVVDDVPYLVMDLLKGESLQHRLQKVKQLSVATTMQYAQQILVGLEAAHGQKIVHRDLKPDNIFITHGQAGELLKILDFGIAKLRQEQGYQVILTQPGAVMGTPEYMAPEQAYSADQVDARSDVYSVGVMLFEMLSGKRPAEGESPQEIAHKILTGLALRLDDIVSELPPGLVRVVHTAIQPRPEDRWEDATALREALLPFLPNQAPNTQSSSRVYTVPQSPFIGVKRTPRIDGTRPVGPHEANGAAASSQSLKIPIEVERLSHVADTVPPEPGAPRASAVPPITDPSASNERTASMDAMPDRRSTSPVRTVNIPAPPHVPDGRGITAVSRSKRRGHGFAWWLGSILLLGGAGAGVGYYWYTLEDPPVPPPLPARRAVPNADSARGVPPASSGPVRIAPLEPAALEVPARQPSERRPTPSPRPAPQPAPAVPPPNQPSAAPSTPAPQPPPPVFAIPTSITLPFPIPTSIPTTFPPIFNIPGLTPAPPPSST